MIEIDGKYYIIDMDRMMSWICETPSPEKNIITITTMNYPITNDDEEDIVEKEVTENKQTLNETMNNIRYDFVRIMINTLMNTFMNNMNQIITMRTQDLSFGQKLAFNTLLDKNIIKEITLDKNEQ